MICECPNSLSQALLNILIWDVGNFIHKAVIKANNRHLLMIWRFRPTSHLGRWDKVSVLYIKCCPKNSFPHLGQWECCFLGVFCILSICSFIVVGFWREIFIIFK